MGKLRSVLGKNVANARRRARLTQEQLAEQTGYSVDFIGLIERGINAPTLDRLEDIARELKIDPWLLLQPSSEERRSSRSRK